jgi:hypothetical protein
MTAESNRVPTIAASRLTDEQVKSSNPNFLITVAILVVDCELIINNPY